MLNQNLRIRKFLLMVSELSLYLGFDTSLTQTSCATQENYKQHKKYGQPSSAAPGFFLQTLPFLFKLYFVLSTAGVT